MSLKRTIGEAYAKYRIRTSRGDALISEIDSVVNHVQKAGVIALVINTYFGFLIPLWILPLLWIGNKIVKYTLGWYDEKHLKWWQFENEYNSRHLNPWNTELMKSVKRIEDHLIKD